MMYKVYKIGDSCRIDYRDSINLNKVTKYLDIIKVFDSGRMFGDGGGSYSSFRLALKL